MIGAEAFLILEASSLLLLEDKCLMRRVPEEEVWGQERLEQFDAE